MKQISRYILLLLLIAAAAAGIYWQYHRKKIIKDAINNTVLKKTDSLYQVHYDSSKIDELGGNAVFYNVSLQSDVARKRVLESTDSLPPLMYFITADEVNVKGVDVPGLLQQQFVNAQAIVIKKPLIQVIKTGSTAIAPFGSGDSTELYKRLLGNFNSIHTGNIKIEDGIVLITDRRGKPISTFDKINISLGNFLIDSRHSYENIISYFIKDIKVDIGDIQFPESKDSLRVNISGFSYDASQRKIFAKEITQYRSGNSSPLSSLKNTTLDGLNTDAFIHTQKLQAYSLNCEGGLVTLLQTVKQGDKTPGRSISFSSSIIDNIQLQSISLGNTKVILTSNSKASPLVLSGVSFNADSLKLTEGHTINDLLAATGWKISLTGLSFKTENGLYEIRSGPIYANNKTKTATVSSLIVKPLLSEDEFAQRLTYQQDRYDFRFNQIELAGIDFSKLFTKNILEAETIKLQPILDMYNDRTLSPNPASKLGKYPHQLLQKITLPVCIKNIIVKNGMVSYTEKANQSKMKGRVFFSNIQATISNATNIDSCKRLNHFMKLDATGLFLGSGKLHTTWVLPLTAGNEEFKVAGKLGYMNAGQLNPLIEPLAMATVKSGIINNVDFTLTGNDNKATGEVKFLYEDLKIALLKKSSDTLKEKDVASMLLNAFVKNRNNSNEPRRAGISYDRDINRSFFNLLWKSIFSGIKKTAL